MTVKQLRVLIIALMVMVFLLPGNRNVTLIGEKDYDGVVTGSDNVAVGYSHLYDRHIYDTIVNPHP